MLASALGTMPLMPGAGEFDAVLPLTIAGAEASEEEAVRPSTLGAESLTAGIRSLWV